MVEACLIYIYIYRNIYVYIHIYIYIHVQRLDAMQIARHGVDGRRCPVGGVCLGLSAGLFCSNSYLYYVGSFKGFYKESIVGPYTIPGPTGVFR